MTETPKTKIGLLGLMFDLYERWPEIKPLLAEFAGELVETLSPFAEVDFPGVCTTREQVERAVAGFEADGVDLLMVVMLSYAPSHIALPALIRTPLPVLLFNTQQLHAISQQTVSLDTTRNHGMHGVQDLANVLLRAGRDFHLVTGHYQDERTLAQVKSWCDAARTVRFMRQMQIGLLGHAMEGMGDFGLDETTFLAQAGITVRRIPMKTVADLAQAAPQAEIARQMAADRERFQFQEDITSEEHEASSRLEWALRQILRRRQMHGFAAHFMAIGDDGRLDTLPFLAASKLLGEGYGFGGEGDVTSAAAVAMMAELAGAANFTEMFSMDFAGNAVLMMHMGEGNWQMARKDEPVHLLRSALDLVDLRHAPLLPAFSLEPGPATLVSLTTVAEGQLKFIVTEGEVVDFPYVADMGRPHYKFRPQGDLSDFLTRFSLAGGSHHQAMAYGCWAGAVEKIAAL
ncbi:MAG TPA: arabinose isomerase, partial [Caldilineae bacterium]|nr:arabinose isomerase [Caldilineae bacterium]